MKLYVNGIKESNLRYKIGKKFKKRLEKQRLSRKNVEQSPKEKLIAAILRKNNIEFLCEHSPEGLLNPKTLHPLFFDFYLPVFNAVIEYDGQQHYEPIHGKKQLKEYQYRDSVKTLFCRYNSIKLLRIPYTCQDIEAEICRFFDKHYPILNSNPGQ